MSGEIPARSAALLALLAGLAPHAAMAAPFADSPSATAGLATLNSYLTPLSPSVSAVRCDLLIQAGPGSAETIYAGICTLRSDARIMACGDTGIGEFALTPWRGKADAAARARLVTFANANCPGG